MARHLDRILECYSAFWGTSHGDSLMKSSIVRGLLVLAQQARESLLTHVEFLLPVFDYGTNTSEDDSVYLMEDVLMTWCCLCTDRCDWWQSYKTHNAL